jgi:hypothetical protein
MTAGQLMSRVVLDEKVLADLLTALTKGVHLSLQGHALQLLLVAARTQRMAEMPKLAGAHIMQVSTNTFKGMPQFMLPLYTTTNLFYATTIHYH